MKIRVLIALFTLALALPLLGAEEELPAGTVAHGSIEEAHEQAYPEHAEEGHHEERTYFGIPGWLLKIVNLAAFLGLLWWLLSGPVKKAYADRK
ncbi:MAG: hypothetical protein R3338_03505, partial [Thermoanaerobaculia bacterium]|nr:hypothetical protein [Thermoanaerobaculia bacterium]